MDLVHYFGGWVEGPSKQTDRTDGGWVQSTFGAKAEQIIKNLRKTAGKFNDCFLGKTSLAKNFQMVFRGRGGGETKP